MDKYFTIFKDSYQGYFNYLMDEISRFHWENYFYGLIIVSLVVWGLELLFPWRKNQKIFRKDFWLDTFYMFFNFFLLNLIVLIFLSNTTEALFNDLLGFINLKVSDFQLVDLDSLPWGVGLLVFFLIVRISLVLPLTCTANFIFSIASFFISGQLLTSLHFNFSRHSKAI